MSKREPVWGIDAHPEYQRGLDWNLVADRGYEFAFIKASQGSAYVPDGFKHFYRAAKESGLICGLYHFLDESASAKAQAQNFLRTIGNIDGRLIAVDFENYGVLSPTNATLKAFIVELRREIGSHPIILYSSESYWESGVPSGDFHQYDANIAWEARYADMEPHDRPRHHYKSLLEWDKAWGGFGGVTPWFWQFTSTGKVADQYLDVDAYRGTRESLLSLTEAPLIETIPKYVREALEYLEACEDGPYVVWSSGHFKDGPPAWVSNTEPPPASTVRRGGSFCAGLPNLACRVNGHYIFEDTATAWAGGVKWWSERVQRLGIGKPFDVAKTYPPGTMFLRRYTGPELENQGHIAIQGRHGRLLQADFFQDGRDGINENRGLKETNDLLKRFDGAGFEYAVDASDWLK